MPDLPQPPATRRSALFVDFDNIYLGLLRMDPLAAERFAREPLAWVRWIEEGMRVDKRQQPVPRSVLIRRCYLTVSQPLSAEYCNCFIRAGFSVVPCAPLTRSDKNSADIHMAIDILDLARRSPQIDEFVLFSGDSDFAPVLVRLREMNRRSSLVTNGAAAYGYTGLGDQAASAEQFLSYVIGRSKPHLFSVLADKLDEALAERDRLADNDIEHVFEQIGDYSRLSGGKRYFGFGSLPSFVRELQRRHPGLRVVEDGELSITSARRASQPDVIALLGQAPEAARGEPTEPASAQLDRTPPTALQDRPDIAPARADLSVATSQAPHAPLADHAPEIDRAERPVEQPAANLKQQITKLLLGLVAQADKPLQLGDVAAQIHAQLGSHARDYIKKRGLGKFITQQELPNLATRRAGKHGYLYDPTRHAPPEEIGEQPQGAAAQADAAPAGAGGQATVSGADAPPAPALEALMLRLQQAFGLPSLPTTDWETLYAGLEYGFERHSDDEAKLRKAVQLFCKDRGQLIEIEHITFAMRALAAALRYLDDGQAECGALELAKSVRNGVVIYCDQHGVDMSTGEDMLLDRWLLGRYYSDRYSGGEQARAVNS